MSSMRTMIEKIRLPIFLIILLLFLVAYPYFHQRFPEQIAIVELFFALLMIAGLSLLVHRKSLLVFAAILAIIVLIGILVSGYMQSRLLVSITILIELIFFSVIFVSILYYVYTQKVVTLNKIFAAVTSYLVLGILFALLYTLVATISPNAFQSTVSASMKGLKYFPHPSFFIEALYFSFVTLSTLGYGDWVPILGPIKMVSSLEAIAGQLFIAILIARLVGIHISQMLIKRQQ